MAAAAASAAPLVWQAHGLGELGGLALQPADGAGGRLVGVTRAAAGSSRVSPFVYSPAEGARDLSSLLGPDAQVLHINARGDLVGQSIDSSSGMPSAFRVRDGVVERIAPSSSGAQIRLLNERGVVGGEVWDARSRMSAVVVDLDGALRVLDPSSSWSQLRDLNERGQAIANGSKGGFLASETGLRYLGLGGRNSSVADLNNHGQVVGSGWKSGQSRNTAFFFDGSTTQALSLGGHTSEGAALNDRGEVVGRSLLADNTSMRAFLLRDGLMQDLGTLGGSYSAAYDISETGTVLGQSSTADGQTQVFVHDADTGMRGLSLGGTSWHRDFNEAGWVLGQSYRNARSSGAVGYFFDDGERTLDLNLLVAELGIRDIESAFFTDHGSVAGFGRLDPIDGVPQWMGFEVRAARAVSAPGALALSLLALASLAWVRRRPAR